MSETNKYIYSYSLLVRRYGRILNFDTVEELREELKAYFARCEQHIVGKLTQFPEDGYSEDGMHQNLYRDITVTAYRFNKEDK